MDKAIGNEDSPDCGLHLIPKALREKHGLQPCGECFTCHLVEVFREIRRILHPTGVLLLNLGDSFCSTAPGTMGDPLHCRGILKGVKEETAQARRKFRPELPLGLKSKDLIGAPWRVALALQADGWYLRSDIPWVKRGCMPESVTDRPAKSLEYVFLLAKSEKYFWDLEAVKKYSIDPESHRGIRKRSPEKYAQDFGMDTRAGLRKKDGEVYTTRNFRNADLWFESIVPPHGLVGSGDELLGLDVTSGGGYGGQHFATFPAKLITPLIKAATSQKGVCPKCGAPWTRIVEKDRKPTRPGRNTKVTARGEDSPTDGTSGEYSEDGRAQFRAKRLNPKDQGRKEQGLLGDKTGLHQPGWREGRASKHEDSPYHQQGGSVVGNRDPQRHCTESRTLGWAISCSCYGLPLIPPEPDRDGPEYPSWIRERDCLLRLYEPLETVPATVCDPFCGVATTLLVCQRLGRRGIGVELSEEYAKQAERRLRTRGASAGRENRDKKRGFSDLP